MSTSEMTMIERVARALCSNDPGRICISVQGRKVPQWRLWEKQARRAIEAMRQATVEMSAEGQRIVDAGDAAWPSDAVWQAMIDAALAEPPT